MLRQNLAREPYWLDLGLGVRVRIEALAERAILDWEDVGDADYNPTPVTPEGIAALLDIWPIFERFRSQMTFNLFGATCRGRLCRGHETTRFSESRSVSCFGRSARIAGRVRFFLKRGRGIRLATFFLWI